MADDDDLDSNSINDSSSSLSNLVITRTLIDQLPVSHDEPSREDNQVVDHHVFLSRARVKITIEKNNQTTSEFFFFVESPLYHFPYVTKHYMRMENHRCSRLFFRSIEDVKQSDIDRTV